MFSLFKLNKNLVISTMFFFIIVTLFGFNFLISILGNILLLLVLIPILISLVALIGINSFKSKLNICETCGSISLGLNNKCLNCGADIPISSSEILRDAKDSTIEVKAEEIK